MANENFTPEDHSWTVRYGFPADFTQWREFFGDEYNWTSMVPILWQSVDSPTARILPPKPEPLELIFKTCAWWNGALHLLVFGMGWVNVAKGLREWREGGYSRENAILRLVFDTYGSSIEALELWLQKGYLDVHLRITGEQREAARPSADELEAQKMRLNGLISSGPRHQLSGDLINGNDALHLSMHFPGSIGDPHDSPTRIDEDLRDDLSPHRQLRVRLYKGWHRAVSEYLREQELAATPDGVLAAVLVSRLGYLGTYALSPSTGRAFRRSPQTEFSRDHDYHLMGN